MKQYAKVILILLLFVFGFICVACKNESDPKKEPDELKPTLKIEKTEYELMETESERIQTSIENTSEALEIVYEPANAEVANVENGRLVALSAGDTTISAYLKDYPDNKITLNVKVTLKPRIVIEGENEVYTKHTVQLSYNIVGTISSSDAVWESSDNTIATVDQNGLVSGHVAGTTVISVKIGDYKGSFTMKVVKEPNQYVLNFNGGYSQELYEANGAKASLALTSYNGSFWSDKIYEKNIFISNKTNDPKATFSDRIYIGKNSETGYYEVLSIIQSGSSSWAAGAEYVVTISNSYKSFATVHKQTELVSVGDVVFINGDFTKASISKPVDINFFDKVTTSDKLVFNQGDVISLPENPKKLGNRFLGWVDADGNPVTSVPKTISGLTNIYASWFEIDPVTALNVEDFATEIETGDTLKITASVSPSNAYFKTVLYSTSNKDIVNVDANGNVTAVNAGKAIISVQDYVGKFVKKYEITVNMISSIDITFAPSYDGVLSVGETFQLEPTLVGKASGTLSYVSNDSSIITVDGSGLVKAVKEGNATVTISAGSLKLEVGFTVNNLSTSDKVDEVIKLLAENNFAVVDTGNACLYNDGRERYYKPTYGSVNRFLFTTLEIDTKYSNTAANNDSGHKSRRAVDTIEFVCVHDTATLTGTSESIASYMASGNVSIHYTVGNDLVWSVVPEEYIAYHAGDGTGSTFTWFNTGVDAVNGQKPKFSIVAKEGGGYIYACNGVTTNIAVPDTGNTPTTDALLTYLGPTWKIENGKYYMGLTWWSSDYGKISSHGGNNNSIGIEMNVNVSDDSYDTWQRTAKLVADILIRNNLDPTRVQMHNTFSGKNCAQVFLSGNIFPRFMEMVELEYALQTKYKDVEITFKSNNKTLLGDDGRIIKAPEVTTTVSYDVTVKSGSTSKTITLYSVVPGTTTWEQWNGTYLSSVIWKNGYFCRYE